jgi:hypothetical protein
MASCLIESGQNRMAWIDALTQSGQTTAIAHDRQMVSGCLSARAPVHANRPQFQPVDCGPEPPTTRPTVS